MTFPGPTLWSRLKGVYPLHLQGDWAETAVALERTLGV